MPAPRAVKVEALRAFGKSHHPNQRTHHGMVRTVVSATLIELPMNVPSEAWKLSSVRIGLRNFISSLTTGKRSRSPSMAAFQFGGPSPVVGSIVTQHEVALGTAWLNREAPRKQIPGNSIDWETGECVRE